MSQRIFFDKMFQISFKGLNFFLPSLSSSLPGTVFFLCHCNFLYHKFSFSPCWSLSQSLSHNTSLYFVPFLLLCIFLSHNHYLKLSQFINLSLPLTITFSLSFSPALMLSFTLKLSQSLYFRLSFSLTINLSPFLSDYHSLDRAFSTR